MLERNLKTAPLEDKLANLLYELRSVVFTGRFTDRYGHRELIEAALKQYNEKREKE